MEKAYYLTDGSPGINNLRLPITARTWHSRADEGAVHSIICGRSNVPSEWSLSRSEVAYDVTRK